MNKSNSEVCHLWAHGHAAKGSNLYSDGKVLTSYRTPIAAIIDGIYYISSDSMTMTTAKQLSYARRAARGNGQIFYTPAFRYGRQPDFTHEYMLNSAAEYEKQKLDYILVSKSRKNTKLETIIKYNEKRQEILDLAGRFNVQIEMPEYVADESTISEYYKIRAEQARIKAEKEAKELKKQLLKDKKEFKQWLETGAGRCPVSFTRNRYTEGDFITIKDNQILTSQGAACPIDHCIKALKFYDSLKTGKGFIEYKTNGHKIHLGIFILETIDKNGNVKAGCHMFTHKEIARFRKQWAAALCELPEPEKAVII